MSETVEPAIGKRHPVAMTWRRKLLFSVIPLIVVYAIAEAILSTLYLRGDVEPVSIWVHEQTGKGSTIQFAPISGYRLTQTPSRMACIATNGVVESIGTIRGNNHGFPDRDNFDAKKEDASRMRFAMFGDSFSSAQFLQTNWPDKCEELAKESDVAVDLMNFSIDGGGIVNWWSTLRGFVDARDVEIDGVIFAVFGNDLRRPFAIWDDRIIPTTLDGSQSIGFGSVHTYDITELPQDFQAARRYFTGLPGWQILSTESLDEMLEGETRPSDGRQFRFYLSHWIYHGIAAANDDPIDRFDGKFSKEDVVAFNSTYPRRRKIWTDIHEYLKARGLPALVVIVPSREDLLKKVAPDADAEAFAQTIDAKLVDGAKAFDGLNDDEIRACWLTYDGHWGQTGSDRFATFMLKVLKDWPRR